jgi:hypothetical protein
MKLNAIAEAMRRRWWAVAGVMLITVFGVAWTVSANARYEATAILLLASPAITGAADGIADEGDGSALDPDAGVEDEGDGSALDPAVVVEVAGGDITRESLGLAATNVDYSITASENGIIRVETFADSESPLVEAATTLMNEIERIVTELDTADTLRTAETRVLSEPRFVRQRTVVEVDGTSRTEFFAAGSVLLEIDETLATPPENPYVASDQTLRVIEEVASTDPVIEAIREAVGDREAAFEFVFQQRDAAPLVHVVASATTPEATISTLDAALTFLDADLADRQAQAGAAESTWISFQRLAIATEAQTPEGSLGRPVATIIVLGLIAATTLAVLIDSLATSRSKRGPQSLGTVWEGESGFSGNGMPGDKQDQSSIHAAVAWLKAALVEPRTRAEIMAGRGAFSERTIDRAARQLGVISVRNESGQGRPATWSLPAKSDSEDGVSGKNVPDVEHVPEVENVDTSEYVLYEQNVDKDDKDKNLEKDEYVDKDETGEGGDEVAGRHLFGVHRNS